MKLVTICPPVTLGTMLQPRVNQSSKHILKYLDGSRHFTNDNFSIHLLFVYVHLYLQIILKLNLSVFLNKNLCGNIWNSIIMNSIISTLIFIVSNTLCQPALASIINRSNRIRTNSIMPLCSRLM